MLGFCVAFSCASLRSCLAAKARCPAGVSNRARLAEGTLLGFHQPAVVLCCSDRLILHLECRSATGLAFETAPRPSSNCPQESFDLTDRTRGRCMRSCKVFGPNRTKKFHVKHFGTIRSSVAPVRLRPGATITDAVEAGDLGKYSRPAAATLRARQRRESRSGRRTPHRAVPAPGQRRVRPQVRSASPRSPGRADVRDRHAPPRR